MLSFFGDISVASVVFVLLASLGVLPVVALGAKSLLRPGASVAHRAVASYARQAQELSTEAGQQLLRADEIVRLARDELAFAQASFGVAQTQSFAALLEGAERAVTDAFRIQASMSGASDVARAESARQILALVDGAIPPILEAQKVFVRQRDAQASVDSRVLHVEQVIVDMRAHLPVVGEMLRSLAVAHSPESLVSVRGAVEQVEELLLQASDAAERARGFALSDRAVAVQAIETAERALRLAQANVDSVEGFDASLSRTVGALAEGVGSLTADLADVESLASDKGAFSALVGQAQQALDYARLAQAGQADPVEAAQRLRTAEAQLDAALAPLRQAQEVQMRRALSADRYLAAARDAVSQAQRASSSQRARVGVAGMASVREAELLLAQAERVRTQDPDEASRLADEAASLARQVTFAHTGAPGAIPGGFAGAPGASSVDFELMASEFLRGVTRHSRRRW